MAACKERITGNELCCWVIDQIDKRIVDIAVASTNTQDDHRWNPPRPQETELDHELEDNHIINYSSSGKSRIDGSGA